MLGVLAFVEDPDLSWTAVLRSPNFCHPGSGGSGQTGKSGESKRNSEHVGSELVLKTFRGDTDFEVMQGGVTEQLAVSRATKPC